MGGGGEEEAKPSQYVDSEDTGGCCMGETVRSAVGVMPSEGNRLRDKTLKAWLHRKTLWDIEL